MCSSAEGKIRLSFWRFSEKSVKVSYNKKLSQSFIKAKYCISSVERQRGGDKAMREKALNQTGRVTLTLNGRKREREKHRFKLTYIKFTQQQAYKHTPHSHS